MRFSFFHSVRFLRLLGVSTLLCCAGTHSLFANALTTEMAKAAATEALPAGAHVSAIEIQPAKLVINGKFEAAQVIVTARLASGDSADVTRLAALSIEGGIAEVSPTGQIKPLRNGAGAVRAEIAGQSATAPVEVKEMQ